MKKELSTKALIISLVAVVVSVFVLAVINSGAILKVKATDFAYNYFTGITSATSTITFAATTTAIYSGNVPAKVEVCNTIASPAYLYLLATNTTTTMATSSMVVGKGVWLDGAGNTTSTNYVCRQFDNFAGFIRGIGVTTTPVLVNYSR